MTKEQFLDFLKVDWQKLFTIRKNIKETIRSWDPHKQTDIYNNVEEVRTVNSENNNLLISPHRLLKVLDFKRFWGSSLKSGEAVKKGAELMKILGEYYNGKKAPAELLKDCEYKNTTPRMFLSLVTALNDLKLEVLAVDYSLVGSYLYGIADLICWSPSRNAPVIIEIKTQSTELADRPAFHIQSRIYSEILKTMLNNQGHEIKEIDDFVILIARDMANIFVSPTTQDIKDKVLNFIDLIYLVNEKGEVY